MINDATRTTPLIEALRRAIVPGESVVLDLGASFGFFSFIACQLGARKVYAIEPDDAIKVAKLCAENTDYADRITWIQGLSTQLELPEKADIVIADLHGTLPFYNANIASMIDARKRHLKSGGQMISIRDRLYAVPAQAHEEYASVESPWQNNPQGIDFSAGSSYVLNNWWRAKSDVVLQENLLSIAQPWGEIDYRKVESENLDGYLAWTIERVGILHGLYVWFEGDTAEGLSYSNAPTLPELVYGRAFFPMERPIAVDVGDKITCHLSANLIGDKFIFRWDTTICNAQGNAKASFRQTTFKSQLLQPIDLQAVAEDNCPTLNEDGAIVREVLTAFANSKSQGQTARDLVELFPQRFDSVTTALNHVVDLARKFSATPKP
ncbi:MAG: 50S ribosomal protein L11 methyltransferase [Arenimonas sp.]